MIVLGKLFVECGGGLVVGVGYVLVGCVVDVDVVVYVDVMVFGYVWK